MSTVAVNPQVPPPAEPHVQESFKETLESLVIALILAFLFRIYVVEAFVIPSGSMAPTLLGDHLDLTCSQCGYRFATDVPDSDRNPSDQRSFYALTRDQSVVCPMCHFPISVHAGTFTSAGDRILVQKYLYSVVDPRRWDVVVFKNPVRPDQNYIKRLIGLPNESILIVDGNIFVGKGDEGHLTWKIARKTDRPQSQRAIWRPIYHSDYIPIDKGADASLRGENTWSVPWVAADNSAGTWDIADRRSYHVDPGPDSSTASKLRFDFDRCTQGGPGWYPYNFFRIHGQYPDEVTEEVRIGATFLPEKDGLEVGMQTSARLDDKLGDSHRLYARIDAAGNASLLMEDSSTQVAHSTSAKVLESGHIEPLKQGIARNIELWYVDCQASLWVDGNRILVHDFDPENFEDFKNRRPFTGNPEIAITVRGAPATLQHVELDRDIYYTQVMFDSRAPRAGRPGWGVLAKDSSGSFGGPVRLGPDQFFCLGDNSPMSQDGRLWYTADPWVEAEFLDQKPQKYGIVPRELLMGRAFFVYFPAPYAFPRDAFQVIPNFTDMRFIK